MSLVVAVSIEPFEVYVFIVLSHPYGSMRDRYAKQWGVMNISF